MSEYHSVDRIIGMLHDRAESLARELLGGRKEGKEWRADPKRAGGIGNSLSVNLSPSKLGVWFHGAAGIGGRDMLGLIAHVHGSSYADAVDWARRWLGLDDGKESAEQLARRDAERRERREKALAKEKAEASAARARALRLFMEAQPIAGTPVEHYLAARGLDIRKLGAQPGALRFHPDLTYTAAAEGGGRLRFPAMLALVKDPRRGAGLTVHRTWIAQVNGVWRKAPVDEPKKTYSSYAGGIIELSKGDARLSIDKAPEGAHVIVTEGIEDALSIALASPALRVVAAVAVGNMTALRFGANVTRVTIGAQNDPIGSEAREAVARAQAHFLGAGLLCDVAYPPAGVKDWAEIRQLSHQRRQQQSDAETAAGA